MTLSMICCASRTDEMVMTVEDIQRAAYLLAEVEVKMGTVFKGMGRSDISSLINDAMIYIVNSHTNEMLLSQFAKHFEGDMDKVVMDRVLQTMESMGVVELVKKPGIGTVILIKGV